MSKWNKKPMFVDLDYFNAHLENSACYRTIYYDPRDTDKERMSGYRFLWIDGKHNQHLLYRDRAGTNIVYHLALDLFDLKAKDNYIMEGWEAFRKSLNPYILGCREDIYLENNDDYLDYTTEQYQYCNLDYRDTWIKCYSYDINSCFLSFLDYPLPDNKIKREWSIVENGEIGFNEQFGYLVIVKKGKLARWVFDKRRYKSLSKYAHAMYHKKQKATTEEEKAYWKDCMVKSIGYLKYVNVFLRSAILNYAKARILNAMDEDTVYCNTDSIISLKPRTDLDIGEGLGQFKEEHIDKYYIFRSIGINVWLGEGVKYRGQKKNEIFEDETHYWTYTCDTVIYNIKKNQMVFTGKKGVKTDLWQKPDLKQASTVIDTTQDTTQLGTD